MGNSSPDPMTWYRQATRAWRALVPLSDGPGLLETANPRELREAIKDPATWRRSQRKFLLVRPADDCTKTNIEAALIEGLTAQHACVPNSSGGRRTTTSSRPISEVAAP
ncbi:hypothetical protein ACGFJT_10045 [Actinomadura geliboluensis]|uniref:hypothetical protein n=1 Tax=Actinomadura geliboluensis TaxID=882440 RepID=UPI003717DD37